MDFKKKLMGYKEIVDEEINNILNKKIENENYDFSKKTYEIMKNYMSAGGKRLRPIATIAAFESLKGKDNKVICPAIGIEFLHNSTLCHDDIMDEDEKRRNQISCHKAYQKDYLRDFKEMNYQGDIFSKESVRFGVSISLIAGNIFNYLGYEMISGSKFMEKTKSDAIELITKVMTEVNKGQVLDIYLEKKENVNEKEYFDVISKKTAWLLGGAFELGAIFAEADEKIRKAFFDYGFSLGIAFQITDDLMDIDKGSKKGNSFGSDIRKGKKTIIAIKAIEISGKGDYLNSILDKGDCSNDEVNEVVKIFEKCGAIDYARKIAKDNIINAKESIDKISKEISDDYKEFFYGIADYIIERKI